MCTSPVEHRIRTNLKHVLEALNQETGIWGQGDAETRAPGYCDDPCGAIPEDVAYLGAVLLKDFYVDPTKPNQSERRSLWVNVVQRMGKPTAKDPGEWDGATNVSQLQAIAEEAS